MWFQETSYDFGICQVIAVAILYYNLLEMNDLLIPRLQIIKIQENVFSDTTYCLIKLHEELWRLHLSSAVIFSQRLLQNPILSLTKLSVFMRQILVLINK